MRDTELKVELARTADLVPYAGNAKIHSAEQVEQIAASIEEFGFDDPVGVWTNADGEPEIVEGHGRVMAANLLGMEHVPVIYLDHLTDEQRRAYAHVHNQTTLSSGFDLDALAADMADLPAFDWEGFGFDEVPNLGDEPAEVHEVDTPEAAPARVERGQVWQLGDHRLMCGDSTDAGDVAALMDGQRADVCFTSPPYNMARNRVKTASRTMNGGQAYGMFSDCLTDEDYARLLSLSLDNALSCVDDAMFNIGILSGSKRGIVNMLWGFVDKFADVIVWKKDRAIPLGFDAQFGQLSHSCELVFCFNKSGVRNFHHPQWSKRDLVYNVIETKNNIDNKFTANRAAFPVELAAEVVRNFTDDSVLDLFGGTGTTLMAAEQLGRKCYMMELDPHYCDVIIERWEQFTGRKAVLA